MTILSKALDANQISLNLHYVKEIKIPILNIDDSLVFAKDTKNKFKYNKKLIDTTYNNYIKKYIVPDNSNILGYKKFANIINKNYFLN